MHTHKYLTLLSVSLILFTKLSFAASASAILAGGCFWCLEADFDKLPGVIATTSGYDGGQQQNPTYEQVSAGTTHYLEVVKVDYDPDKISYAKILDYYWQHVDPTVKDQQFCDKGKQYGTAIYYLNAKQKTLADASLNKVKKLFPNIYTKIAASTHFYPAEDYHQDYYKKNPLRYKYYRYSCGRDKRVAEIWQDKNL